MILRGAQAIGDYIGVNEKTGRRWIKAHPGFPVKRFKRRLMADSRKIDLWQEIIVEPANEESLPA